MKKILLAGAALAVCIPAQNRMGTFDNTGTTYTTRGGAGAANTNPAVLFVRFDKERYAGWTTGATPGTRDITGVNTVVQDQNRVTTTDTFNLVVYGESVTLPNFPDVATPLALSGAFVLPTATGTGAIAWDLSANFTTPIQAPATGDVFVGLRFNAGWTIVGGAATDGLSVWEIRSADASTTITIDQPGPGRPTVPFDEGTFGGYYVPTPLTGPAYLTTVATMYKIQPILPIAGGVATALTNQTRHVQSTATAVGGFDVPAPGAGTACMLSGLFPDSANPSLNGGRADNIGQIYTNTAANVPVGSLVFYLIDLGTFGIEIPVSAFIPGSTGVTCLNLGTMQTLSIGTMNPAVTGAVSPNPFSFHVSSFPAAARPILSGISWLQQAVGFNSTTLAAHAGPCTRQQM